MKVPVMRRWIAAFGFMALTLPAAAADFDPMIFGPTPYVAAAPTYTRCTGFYFGAQAGFVASAMDFTSANALGPLDPYLAPYGAASEWAQFGNAHANGASFGGFVGYNFQWD